MIGSFLLIQQFNQSGDFGILVNIATIISFLVAPVIAVFNHYLVNNTIEDEYKPAIWLKILSYLGITYLIGFSIFFFDLYFYVMKNHFLSLTALVFLHLLFWIHHVPAQKLTKSYTTDHKKININDYEDLWMVQLQHLEMIKPGGNGYNEFLQKQKNIISSKYPRKNSHKSNSLSPKIHLLI